MAIETIGREGLLMVIGMTGQASSVQAKVSTLLRLQLRVSDIDFIMAI